MADVVRLYVGHHCATYAAAIAYYTLFSLVPLTLIVVSVVGLVVERGRVVDFIFDLVPLEESAEVRQDVNNAVGDAQAASFGVLIASTVVLVWSASGVFGAVRRGLNATTGKPGQSFVRGKLLDLALVPTFGLAILAGLGLLTAVQFGLQEAASRGWLELQAPAVRVLGQALVAAMTLAAFLLLYRFVPRHRPGWIEAGRSAACAAVLFEGTKLGASWLIGSAPFVRQSGLYASIGTALTLLFWVFVSSSILLFGAELGRETTRRSAISHEAHG